MHFSNFTAKDSMFGKYSWPVFKLKMKVKKQELKCDPRRGRREVKEEARLVN